MLKLQRYILSEWLKIFLIAACLVMGLIVVQEVYSRLNGLIQRGASFWEIFLIFLLTVPRFLPSIIPMVLLLSVLFSVSAMHRKNEIIAMKAAGVSLWKISQPLLLAATVCAGAILYLNGSFIPWSVQQQEALQREVFSRGKGKGAPAEAGQVKVKSILNLGFLNFEDRRLWLIGSFVPFDRKGEGVTVYEMDEAGKERYRIRAARAEYRESPQGWVFYNGNELFYDGLTDEPYRNQTFDILEKQDYQEQPDIMVAMRKKPQDLSLYELGQILDVYEGYDNPEIIPYKVRFYRILASPFSCFLVVGFGVPFAVSGVRTNPMIGISKAFGMFLIYFVVSNISTILGDGNYVSPQVSAAIPLVFVGLFAARVFAKAQ